MSQIWPRDQNPGNMEKLSQLGGPLGELTPKAMWYPGIEKGHWVRVKCGLYLIIVYQY